MAEEKREHQRETRKTKMRNKKWSLLSIFHLSCFCAPIYRFSQGAVNCFSEPRPASNRMRPMSVSFQAKRKMPPSSSGLQELLFGNKIHAVPARQRACN